MTAIIETIKWLGDTDGYVRLIDQTLLPARLEYLNIRDIPAMTHAIKTLQVRGAPAIGIAAAYGAVLAAQKIPAESPIEQARQIFKNGCDQLASSRPTAVNLFWALKRMNQTICPFFEQESSLSTDDLEILKTNLLTEANAIYHQDLQLSKAIGRHGAELISDGKNLLTHCNAGALATSGYGTALAPMFTAHRRGTAFHVYVDETRPLLQGARLTTWELLHTGIPCTLICDNMAGSLMTQGKIDMVITGADRIAANGDTANKIGTYPLAVLAHAHNIPFYIAAPSSTFDFDLPDGSQIPIEQRPQNEIKNPFNHPIATADIYAYNPAFDVTPHHLITAIITENGLIQKPDTQTIKDHFA